MTVDTAPRLERLTRSLPSMLADLETLVRCESPTGDPSATSRCADAVAELGIRLLRSHPQRLEHGGAAQLRWRFGRGDRVLLLGHLDTVWPLGGSDALDGATVLITTDEEVGSSAARTLIQDEARRNQAVLVLEASADGGAHAEGEHVLASSMPERAALLAELVADLAGARP
ncbi:acetylornithine deacetylase/succinyl-diaminopimelate desuccinylase-like protein [Catenulispora sp. GAS73]|uniref:hypothetical protein n=1 Tax=Catenulispora sp. GAS73 TaxID=3156269 RepID=UPI003512BFD8